MKIVVAIKLNCCDHNVIKYRLSNWIMKLSLPILLLWINETSVDISTHQLFDCTTSSAPNKPNEPNKTSEKWEQTQTALHFSEYFIFMRPQLMAKTVYISADVIRADLSALLPNKNDIWNKFTLCTFHFLVQLSILGYSFFFNNFILFTFGFL